MQVIIFIIGFLMGGVICYTQVKKDIKDIQNIYAVKKYFKLDEDK